MPDSTITPIETLLAEANAQIETISAVDAIPLLDRDDVLLVDIRDVRELHREGTIPGAYHAPRGMLEFWVDPQCKYHKDVFASGKKFVFFCASGWRSALSTQALQAMGLKPVAHIGGGFSAWRDAGGPTAPLEKKK